MDIFVYGEIICYGEVIGYVVCDILCGSWIDELLVELLKVLLLNMLLLVIKVLELLLLLEGYMFEGYCNVDGSVGIKNLFGIIISVYCVVGVVDYVVKVIECDFLFKYLNVDGVVGLNYLYGCGVVINVLVVVVLICMIYNIVFNFNFGGEVMVIGFGCEKLQLEWLLEGIEDVFVIVVESVSIVCLQDEQYVGFKLMVDDILWVVECYLMKLNQCQCEICLVFELVVGM